MADGENGRRAGVIVQVGVIGGDDQERETAGLPQRIQRAVDGAVAQRVVTPRNDISDFLLAIISAFGLDVTSGFGKLLKSIADWFEDLDPDGSKPWSTEDRLKLAIGLALTEQSAPSAQGLGDWFGGECMSQFLAGVQQDGVELAAQFGQKFTGRLQELMGCALGQNPQAQLAIPGLPQLDLSNIDAGKLLGCLLGAAGVYQNTKSVWQALWSFGTCMAAGGGGGGGAQVEHETVKRC